MTISKAAYLGTVCLLPLSGSGCTYSRENVTIFALDWSLDSRLDWTLDLMGFKAARPFNAS